VAKRVPAKNQREHVLKKEQREGERDISKILVARRDRINGDIIRAAGTTKFSASAIEREKLFRALEGQYIEFSGDTRKWSERQSRKVARTWRNLAIADVPRGAYNQTFGQFDRQYLQDIITRVNPSTVKGLVKINSKIGGMLEADIAFVQKQVSDVALLAASTGMTARQKRLELQARVSDDRPAWQFIDSAGRKWKSENYFKMLNRTISNDVSRDAYKAVMAEAKVDLATIEGGPSTVGDDCDDWVGRIVSITGATEGYPTLEEATSTSHLFGPNCNHYLGAVDDLPAARKQEAEEQGQVKKIEGLRNEAIAAGVPKTRAHEVIEKAAEANKVAPFNLTKKEFNAALKEAV